MRKLWISDEAAVPAQTEYAGPVRVQGVVSSRLMSPPGYSLWMCVSELAAGATIEWQSGHGEEALYILEGELELGGRRCGERGVLVFESGSLATATATVATRLAHWGTTHPSPGGSGSVGGDLVHLVSP